MSNLWFLYYMDLFQLVLQVAVIAVPLVAVTILCAIFGGE
jgi:hypothetical protein